MRYLLDTHVFLWFNMNDERLSKKVLEIISDGQNELYLSAASGLEISIKFGLGKLKLEKPPESYIPELLSLNTIKTLDINMIHSTYLHKLPNHHKDPFDRLLISQAICEKLILITNDELINKYDVKRIW